MVAQKSAEEVAEREREEEEEYDNWNCEVL
jgi:hypothetical protein